MITTRIPGWGEITIAHAVFDYNGTLAIDGKLIKGVGQAMDELSSVLNFHVITADTFGLVQSEMKGTECEVIIIPEEKQAEKKLEFAGQLGLEKTLCVGNGRNDRLMVKEAALGVCLIQPEGAYSGTMTAADLVCHHILDVFAFLKEPKRLIASLRS